MLNDIFEVICDWTHSNGQEAQWTAYVWCTDEGTGAGNAATLATITRNSLDSILQFMTVPAWNPGFVTVQNLTNLTDAAQLPFTYVPQLTGGSLPSFLAVGIRSGKQSFGHNRGRANLPLLDRTSIDILGDIPAAAVEAVEPIAVYAGTARVAITTGERYEPVTVRKIYEDSVLIATVVRAEISGLWEIDTEFTTVKSRQRYAWEAVD